MQTRHPFGWSRVADRMGFGKNRGGPTKGLTMLVQICGLPGAGKSTPAAAIATEIPALWLRVDAIEAAMWRHGIPREHRGRVEQRSNDIPGFTLPTWVDVMRTVGKYEPRVDERLVIDSTRPLEATVREALEFIGAGQ